MVPADLTRWRTVDALFAEALDRPYDERTAFLRARCGHDPALYEAVVALLATDAEAEIVLGESAADFAAPLLNGLHEALNEEPDRASGTHVGPYRVESLIGRGGMGNVYLAERADGVFRKQVALKLVRQGMDTDEVLARFRRERQLLAGLEHPNIARLLDGGVSDDGRPYLVMEHVEGEPITAYCDRLAMDVGGRLRLFEQVCDAVQHAHRRLVVHRDLKPSNILVATDGGPDREPAVKLLDFGVAKLLDAAACSDDPITRAGVRLLTPEYAAPEQIRGDEVTTAADVYSLGVILCELLVGRRPFDLAGLAPHERERVLLQEEPRPLTSLVTDEAAASRSTTTARLLRQLHGDLETIAMTTLRRDQVQRYASVEALLEDLRRQRSSLPIRARRESAGYRAGRFVRRHRWGVASAAAFVLLLGGSVGALALQQRATALERDRAELELAQKTEVTAFLTDLFAAASPEEALGDTLTAYDLLARGVRKADALAEQPAVQAHLMGVLGKVYHNLGAYTEAEALLDRAHGLRLGLFGPDDLLTAESRHDLAETLQKRGDYDSAEALFRSALDIRRARLGLEHPAVAATLDGLGTTLYSRSEFDAAEALIREALAIRQQLDAEHREAAAASLTSLGNLLQDRRRFDEAEDAYRQALALRQATHGLAHPHVALSLMNLATVLINQARLAEAEDVLTEALRVGRAVWGEEHPHVAAALNSLGWLLIDLRRYDEAEPVLREALDQRRLLFGGEHAVVATSLSALATLYMNIGALDSAEALYQESLELRRSLHGSQHRQVAVGLTNLGVVLNRRGSYTEAERVHREAVATFEALLGPEDPSVALSKGNLGEVLHDAGRHHEAAVLFHDAFRALETSLAPDHPSLTRARVRLGICLAELGRREDALPLLQHAHQALLAAHGGADPRVAEVAARLAAVRSR
jgi:eukaryotic-like serine/threonine-protein kinase